VGSTGAVQDVYDPETEKSAFTPEDFAIMASLEPVESLTTVALTPRLVSALMALATALRLLAAPTPAPVGMVNLGPAVVVIVIDEVGRGAVGLDSRSEYHAPVVARLLTTTV
jgi:hypothetical protein